MLFPCTAFNANRKIKLEMKVDFLLILNMLESQETKLKQCKTIVKVAHKTALYLKTRCKEQTKMLIVIPFGH